MQDPSMQGMVDQFMKSKGIEADPAVADAANPMERMAQAFAGSQANGASMEDLMKLGQQFAEHMKNTNPDLISNMQQAMSSQFSGMGMPGAGDEKPEGS